MHPQSIILQLASKCSQRFSLDFCVTSHLWPKPSHKCLVCLWLVYSLWSKCRLLHILEAKATTGWPEDKAICIASIQPVRTKWGPNTCNWFLIASKLAGSCSARGSLPKSLISLSSGYPTLPGFLLSASPTEFLKPGKYTIFNENSAYFYSYVTQQLSNIV